MITDHLNKKNYYTKASPKCEEIVIVKLTEITENGIYGECVNYPQYKVFLLLTEISKKKYKQNIYKMFSPDKKYAVRVININDDMKIMDVSYSKIHESDQKNALEKHAYSERIYNLGQDIIKIYAKIASENNNYSEDVLTELFKYTVQIPLEQLEQLQNDSQDSNLNILEKYKDKYLTCLEDPITFFDKFNEECLRDIDEEKKIFYDIVISEYVKNINKRVKISDVIVTCDISLCVISESAVDVIKDILSIDPNISNIKIEHIASPKYRITCTDKRLNLAKISLDKICSIIKTNAEKYSNQGLSLDINQNYNTIRDKEYSLLNYSVH